MDISKVTSMKNMMIVPTNSRYGEISFKNINSSNVVEVDGMLSVSKHNISLEIIDFTKLTSMKNMFNQIGAGAMGYYKINLKNINAPEL